MSEAPLGALNAGPGFVSRNRVCGGRAPGLFSGRCWRSFSHGHPPFHLALDLAREPALQRAVTRARARGGARGETGGGHD